MQAQMQGHAPDAEPTPPAEPVPVMATASIPAESNHGADASPAATAPSVAEPAAPPSTENEPSPRPAAKGPTFGGSLVDVTGANSSASEASPLRRAATSDSEGDQGSQAATPLRLHASDQVPQKTGRRNVYVKPAKAKIAWVTSEDMPN